MVSDAAALTGFGATWNDWAASHGPGVQLACRVEPDEDSRNTDRYFFGPRLDRGGEDLEFKFSIIAPRKGYVLFVKILFVNLPGSRLSREGPVEPGPRTTYREALQEARGQLPADARFGPTYEVYDDSSGDGCLVQPFESGTLGSIIRPEHRAALIFSSGSESRWHRGMVESVVITAVPRGHRLATCYLEVSP
jgi:hypothetical protein